MAVTKKSVNRVTQPAAKAPAVAKPRPDRSMGVLADLAKRVQTPVKSPKKKDNRPTLDLNNEAQQLLSEFAPLKEISDITTEYAKQKKAELDEKLFSLFLDIMDRTGRRPANPRFSSFRDGEKDCEGLYTVQNRFKINMPEFDPEEYESPADALIDSFVNAGIGREVATRLVDEMIGFTPVYTLNFTELIGDEAADPKSDSAVGSATLLQYLQSDDEEEILDLSPAERKALLTAIVENAQQNPYVLNKETFLDDVTDYKERREDLDVILSIVKPTTALSAVKFGVSDSPAKRNERLRAVANDMFSK